MFQLCTPRTPARVCLSWTRSGGAAENNETSQNSPSKQYHYQTQTRNIDRSAGGGTRVQTPVILRVGLSTEIANERQLGEAVPGCCHVFVGFTGYSGSPN